MYPDGNKCGEMFHPELPQGPFCLEDTDHEGDHDGFSFTWAEEPQVSAEVAAMYVETWRRMPGDRQEGMRLNDDETVTIRLTTLHSAIGFIGISRDPYN